MSLSCKSMMAMATAFLTVASTGVFSAEKSSAEPPKMVKATDAKLIERGRYLVRITGCND